MPGAAATQEEAQVAPSGGALAPPDGALGMKDTRHRPIGPV
jgi:hypothetical protein